MCSLAVAFAQGAPLSLNVNHPPNLDPTQCNSALSVLSVETASSRKPSWTLCASDGYLPLCSDSPMWRLSLPVLWLFPSLCLPQTNNLTKARTYAQVLLQHLHGCSGMSVKTRKGPVQSIIVSRTQLKKMLEENILKQQNCQKFKWPKAQVK